MAYKRGRHVDKPSNFASDLNNFLEDSLWTHQDVVDRFVPDVNGNRPNATIMSGYLCETHEKMGSNFLTELRRIMSEFYADNPHIGSSPLDLPLPDQDVNKPDFLPQFPLEAEEGQDLKYTNFRAHFLPSQKEKEGQENYNGQQTHLDLADQSEVLVDGVLAVLLALKGLSPGTQMKILDKCRQNLNINS